MTTEKPVAWNYYPGWEAVDVAQIILDTGLRPEEVFRIRIENLDFGEKKIFNPFGKTKTARRKVTMTVEVAEISSDAQRKSRARSCFHRKGISSGQSEVSARRTMPPLRRLASRNVSGCTICATRMES